ncbi:MAG: sigma-70 family RNA polymerase sigma factor [candidate division Zixibacteria bacterium]|nr:sigma-70 family RNA polymerase sigma factor [candidate division Zixibacteria bacterium]
MERESEHITAMLLRLQDGDRAVVDALLPLVYGHLKSLAHRQLRGERAGHTLNTTALVHEAYLKMVDQKRVSWQNRAHFLALASQAMRRILIDYARGRLAEKRGGGEPVVTLSEEIHGGVSRAEELIDLDEALIALAALDERQSRIVELQFFGGLTQEEIGEVMKVSVATVGREWRMARAWLSRRLKGDG